jgi:drug/metabolite transporter (DMT)-like permease
MVAFASNSLLCRVALKQTNIHPANFTCVRLIAGTITLWLILRMRRTPTAGGNWLSALALFVYAAGFSFAYVSLPAATGALLLFGAVQVTMISFGVWGGEQFVSKQVIGFLMAFGGLVGLLLPGVSAPPLLGAMLMLSAGIAWGIYSLRGKGAGDPTQVTAGNFLRSVPFAIVLCLLTTNKSAWDVTGIFYAIVSGALASGIGYAIWYSVIPRLQASQAATIQLCVPVIATLGGIILLGEPVTWRFVIASVFVLGGIALVIKGRA